MTFLQSNFLITLKMNFLKSKRKVSLVLGGGGARGLVHIGIIRTLEEKGYQIEEVVGCSIGALIGAAYVEGKLSPLEDWMKTLTKRQVFKLLDFSNPLYGFLKGEKIFETLKDIFPDNNIEDMRIPFRAIATDLRSEMEIVFEKGSIYEAIRASIAIPAVFTSIQTDNLNLVDGGVINPLPINFVRHSRRNIVIAINLDGKPDLKFGPLPIENNKYSISLLQEAFFVMRRRLAQLSIDLYKPDIVINVPHNIASIWDYANSTFLIEKGIELGNQNIPDIAVKKSIK